MAEALVKNRKQRYLLPLWRMDQSQLMNGNKEHQSTQGEYWIIAETGLSHGTSRSPVPRELGQYFKIIMITELSTRAPAPALTTSQDHKCYALVTAHMMDQSSRPGLGFSVEQTRDSTTPILQNGRTRKNRDLRQRI